MRLIHLRNQCASVVLVLAIVTALSVHASAADIEQWGMWEMKFEGPADGIPYRDVQLSATFVLEKDRHTVAGFYDGNGVYKIRFSPPKAGEWQYETTSKSVVRPISGRRNCHMPTSVGQLI